MTLDELNNYIVHYVNIIKTIYNGSGLCDICITNKSIRYFNKNKSYWIVLNSLADNKMIEVRWEKGNPGLNYYEGSKKTWDSEAVKAVNDLLDYIHNKEQNKFLLTNEYSK